MAPKVSDSVEAIKQRLKVAATQNGAVDWDKLFRHYDRDNSGEINYEEFRSAIRQHARVSAEEVSDEQLKVIFKSVDKDNDNSIQYGTEFLAWLDPMGKQKRQAARKKARVLAAVSKQKTFEKSNSLKKANEFLNVESIRRKMRAAAYDNGGVNWRKLFRYYDKDNSGEINLDEFKAAIRKDARVKPEQVSEQALNDLFVLVDQDQDGFVQYETEFLLWLDPKGYAKRHAHEKKTKQEGTVSVMKASLAAVGKLKAFPHKTADKKWDASKQTELSPAMLASIKSKLRVAAYHNGKVNWLKLFRYYDRDNSGEINYDEFRQAIRKDAKVPPEILSEAKLLALFRFVDKDGGNTIAYDTEFVPWLEAPDEAPETREKAPLEPDFAKTEMRRLEEIGLLAQANAAYIRARSLLPFLLRWINYVVDDVNRLTMTNFAVELRDGLILCDLVRNLVPGVDFGPGLYSRPISRPMCISNLEKALSAACRHGLNLGNMCHPSAFYQGRVMQIARALCEMFESLQMRPVRFKLRQLLKEIDAVLAPMGRPLLEKTLSEPLSSGHYLLEDFGDCTRIMALLVACNKATPSDMMQLHGRPQSSEELVHNAKNVNRALAAAGCPTLLEGKEWSSPPCWNFDLMALQIHETWDRIRLEDHNTSHHNTSHELLNFQFKDKEPLRLSSQALREAAAKAYDATRRVQETEPVLPPLFRGARVFGEFVQNLGDHDTAWEYFDVSGNGSVSMTEFFDGARRVGFKGNIKRIFNLIDCNRSGLIERHELFNFCEAAAQPLTEEEIARETAYAEMDKEQRMKEKRLAAASLTPNKAVRSKDRPRKRQENDEVLLSAGVIEFVKLVQTFPSIDEAFDAFDTFGTGTVTMIEFENAAHKLELKANAKKIFCELDLNRSGMIDRKEFLELVNDTMKAHEHRMHKGPRIELLVGDQFDHHHKWPTPSVFEIAEIQELGDLRFASVAEEMEGMRMEEFRRAEELSSIGHQRLVDKIKLALDAGIVAVEDVLAAEELKETDIQSISIPNGDDYFHDESMSAVSINMTPTVSIAARVVGMDSSEQPVWLQTAVVDRTGEGNVDLSCCAFVLEIRERGSYSSELLLQLDAALIVSIEQVGPDLETIAPAANSDIRFMLTARQDAIIGGSAELSEKVSASLFHEASDDLLFVSLLGGPTGWKRREAVHFFDELQVLVHFLGDGGNTIAQVR